MTWNHLQRGVWGMRAGLWVGLAAVALPAGGAVVSWDDAGGSASKLWSDFGNWSPNGSPFTDDVSIGNLAAAANDTTLIDQPFTINSLTITNGADVVNSSDNGATNDFELVVNGHTNVSGAGSTIFIIGADNNDGLDTDTLIIESGGQVQLNSQTPQGTAVVEVDNGLLENRAGGIIFGNGVVEVVKTVALPSTLFINDGTIIAGNIGTLPFSSPPARTLSITASTPTPASTGTAPPATASFRSTATPRWTSTSGPVSARPPPPSAAPSTSTPAAPSTSSTPGP